MGLRVHTARLSYRGADRLDITRQYAKAAGLPFAPSWKILRPVLNARARWKQNGISEANRMSEEIALWNTYTENYLAEMRVSYARSRPAWTAVLAREEVTLCCVCPHAVYCHRYLAADILVKLGATRHGER